MNRRLLSRIMIFVLALVFLAGAVQAAVTAYTAIVQKDTLVEAQTAVDTSTKQPEEAKIAEPTPVMHGGETDQSVALPKKEIDISDVSIAADVESAIKNQDLKNGEKNIKNYKKILKEYDIPEKYKKEIQRLITKGYKIPDVLTAYDFLHEKFGLIDELENLLSKKEGGKSWVQVFEEYNEDYKEFVPRDFDPSYLERLMNMPGITTDDIMNADRVSQRGLKTFEELIAIKKEGKTWKDINSSLGVVNTSEKMPRVNLTGDHVQKCMKSTQMSEKKVMEILVMAAKLGKNEDEVIKNIKSGKKKEEIYSNYYDEKYR